MAEMLLLLQGGVWVGPPGERALEPQAWARTTPGFLSAWACPWTSLLSVSPLVKCRDFWLRFRSGCYLHRRLHVQFLGDGAVQHHSAVFPCSSSRTISQRPEPCLFRPVFQASLIFTQSGTPWGPACGRCWGYSERLSHQAWLPAGPVPSRSWPSSPPRRPAWCHCPPPRARWCQPLSLKVSSLLVTVPLTPGLQDRSYCSI